MLGVDGEQRAVVDGQRIGGAGAGGAQRDREVRAVGAGHRAQRAEGFAVNLGQIFDLVNLDLDAATPQANPLGAQDQGANTIAAANVTTLAIEVPAACLNDAADTVVGGWTTASLRQARVLNPTATYANPTREGDVRAPAEDRRRLDGIPRVGPDIER